MIQAHFFFMNLALHPSPLSISAPPPSWKLPCLFSVLFMFSCLLFWCAVLLSSWFLSCHVIPMPFMWSGHALPLFIGVFNLKLFCVWHQSTARAINWFSLVYIISLVIVSLSWLHLGLSCWVIRPCVCIYNHIVSIVTCLALCNPLTVLGRLLWKCNRLKITSYPT